jgi:type IV pilus assembly protein PilF
MKHPAGAFALALLAVLGVAQAAEPSMDREQRADAATINAQLGLEYMRQGDLNSARDKIEKALAQDPHTAYTQMAAGFLYDRLGDDSKAESHFEQAMKLGKGDPVIMNNYATYLCSKGDKKRGEAYFLQAAANPLYRTPEIAYANAGRCARADGRPKDAEKYFRQALAYRADQLDSLFEMAALQHELGSDLQARAFLERYAAIAPVSAASLWLGYRIERGLGDYEQAEQLARRIRKDFATSPEMGLLADAERARK